MNQFSPKSNSILSILLNTQKTLRILSVTLFCMMAPPAFAWGTGNFKVESIQVVGLKGLSQEAVLYQLPIRTGDWFDESKSETLIKKLYATRWFEEVKLTRQGSRLEIKVVERPIVSQVVLKGNHGLPQEALDKMLQELGLAAGEFFAPSSLELAKASLIQLYKEGGKYNSKITTSVIPETENIVKVEIKVEQGPTLRFASVRLLGTKAFSEKRVLAELPISTYRFWGLIEGKSNNCTRTARAQALAALTQFYKNQGYYDIQINTNRLSVTGNRSSADWVIELTEGPRYKVGQYRILGEAYDLSEEKLKSLSHFKTGNDYSDRARLNAQTAIKEHFAAQGYIFAKVQIKPHADRKTSRIHLAIQIERGDKVHVRRIDFLGSRSIKEFILRRLIVQEEAALASGKDHESSEANLQQSGFLEQANIEVTPVPEAKDQVDLTVSIVEKPPKVSISPFGLSWGGDGAVWNIDVPLENMLGTGNDFALKVMNDKKATVGELNYKSSYTDILGLQDVRWNLSGHLSSHRTEWRFKTLKNFFYESPYINSMRDNKDFIKSLFPKDIAKKLKRSAEKESPEKPKEEVDATNKETDKKDTDTKTDEKKTKIKQSRYSFDEKGLSFGIELPDNKSNNTWKIIAELKALDFYFLKEKEYAEEIQNFVNQKGNAVDQFSIDLTRYATNLRKRYGYFPTRGSESRLSLKFAFSGIHKSEDLAKSAEDANKSLPVKERLLGQYWGKRIDAFSSNPLHYFKLNYSGGIFGSFMPDSRFGGHVLGFKWNLGIGQQLSKAGGDLPFFDAYHGGRFYGYEEDALGPRDNCDRMRGGSLLAKGRLMYFFPKPAQGDFLGGANLAWPYRTIAFLQVGNVYKLDSFASLTKKSYQDFPVAVSGGIAFEALLKLPMIGHLPFYASLAYPFFDGGESSFKAKHVKYFNIGIGFAGAPA